MGKPFYVLCVLLLSIFLAGCDTEKTKISGSSGGVQKIIQLDKLAPLPPKKVTDGEDIIRVAVAAILSPTGTIDSYSPFLAYLEKSLDRPVRLVQRKTYEEINDLLSEGSVDIAFICTGAYLEGIKKDIMSILVVPQINGQLTYQSFVIVQESSTLRSLEDLRGRIFAFTDPISNTGYFYPVSLLTKRGETSESFFERTIFTYSHDRSIQAVADGVADGAAVDNLILEHARRRNPELTDLIRVIRKSEKFGIPPVVIPRQLESSDKKVLERFLLDIHNHEEGRQALAALGIEKFVMPDLSLYNF